MATTLLALAELIHATIHNRGADDVNIGAIGLDSSTIATEAAVFAAVPGTRVHGATYAGRDNAAHAVAILTDSEGAQLLRDAGEQRPVLEVADLRAVLGVASSSIYGDPSKDFVLIGVTGTSGKTTTSYLLEKGLMAAGHKVGLIGTTGTRIDGEAVATKLTTPEAPTLQALFSRMREHGVSHVVMEVSSHALSLGRVAGAHFDVAAFTNLSQDHLDFHPTMEEYFDAKALFFRADSPLAAARQVVCIDDSWGHRMAEVAGNGQTVSTHGEDADYRASHVNVAESGAQTFTITSPSGESVNVDLALPGAFNVANATLAYAAAARAAEPGPVKFDGAAFARGMSEVAVPGRMERIDVGQDFLAVVDYAHKPAAVAAVLDTLRTQIDGRLGVVIGAGGDRDATKRGPMGQLSAQRADLVIITDDNPRSEDPATIRQAVTAGAHQGAKEADHEVDVREIGDRAEAIRTLVEWAQPGDGIVVAGKGHEVGQLVAGVTHHFDDREQVREALSFALNNRDNPMHTSTDEG
ncbi:UDP-N-acetylmuramoyl-L-alanyl-D-glutamate-2,6-diaminopimelate ligase [Corynebacterium deserti GIMN1.010]|uniref:UDP-N-acetylmuramoyl-L-alanyl-D-glutamate--2,6-diaminopimelate ligase n=1 Tax=Corynebacterium deserti GIMN1.010 TaxID=931089 RepID=A0A0M5ILU5_9CORY|nr:UDP-N-acetylmuramoyl-L-alanyl-D-glutamate--2,6-diaminopimelate ligase [Corynebacterium deserti]ALC06344.1 UDP-N-acetylmuramoyl-L-alanyl-D-glutamate-2,6-diaminopimelate ligase [Corynebacterium deserti GIMN1.010]